MRLVWGLGLVGIGALLLIQAAPAPSPPASASAPAAEELRLDPEALLRPEELENPAPAERIYRRALGSARDPGEKAELLLKIGLLEERLGRPSAALASFEEALRLAREARSALLEAHAAAFAGHTSSNLSELEEAAKFFEQALEKWEQVGSSKGRLRTLQDLARLKLQIGEPASALVHLGQAREIDPGHAGTLHLIGMSFYLGERSGFALQMLQRALDQARSEKDAQFQARVLGDLGSVALHRGDVDRASAAFEECLRISLEESIPQLEAYARAGRGRVHGLRGRFDQAMAELDRADAMFRSLGEPGSLSLVLAGKAMLERERGNLQQALKLSRESMELIESQRQEIENPRTRAALLGVWSNPYEIQIDVLWRLGFAAEAFEVSEKIRARTLYEGVAAWGTSDRPETASLIRQRREVTLRLRQLAGKNLRLPKVSGDEVRSEKVRIDAEIRELLERESSLLEQIRRSDPRSVLARLQPLLLPQVQDLLDDETALLVYTLGQERSFVWWIEQGSISMWPLPARKEIEDLARQAPALLANPRVKDDPAKLALLARLSELVLAPVAAELPRVRHVAVVPDGALQVLPFAALPRPRAAGEPLVASHVLVNLPSPSTLAALRRREAERTARPDKLIAVIIDPVYGTDDLRLSRPRARSSEPAGPWLARLEKTAKEAEAILKLVPPGKGRKISGFEAVPDVVKDTDLRRYRYLHFGAHGFADLKHPMLSGIVLSRFTRDGRSRDDVLLPFYDVYSLDLPVELVSLSTCRSAEGPQVRREGPITMTRSFFYAGASRVLGTLWDVKDNSAAELTAAFYEGVLRDGKPSAEALRDAQDAMRRNGWSVNDWAPFVLQGDWR